MLNKRQTCVMIVDDVPSMRDLLEEQLTEAGYQTVVCASAKAALQLIDKHAPDIVLTDLKMPEMNGLEFCKQVSTTYPQIRTIVMTAFGNMERAIEAIRAGAFDFLPKPFNFDILELTIQRAVEHVALRNEIQHLKNKHTLAKTLIGESPTICDMKTQIQRMALVDLPVFIHGESGVGKELVAHSLHQHSPRAQAPFITVNCAALPMELLESELFGHIKGAFTGALKAHKGLFRQADGGTLFLDEIGDMPLQIQSKLLRVLQEKLIRPVGSANEISVDVRIVSASHKDIVNEDAISYFRRDLLFRLNVLNITVPPLRERKSDIPILAKFFLKQAVDQYTHIEAATFSTEALAFMMDYHWPGNVRELKNNVLAASAMCTEDNISPELFPAYQTFVFEPDRDVQNHNLLETVINRHILTVLAQANNNKSIAAKQLGIDRKTLYTKLNRINKSF